MNPAEQRDHRTRFNTLSNDVVQLSEDLDGLDKHVENNRIYIETSVGTAFRRITDLREEHRDKIDAARLEQRVFVTRGFWSRLNWLITGR